MTTKQQMIEALRQLPEEATIEDAMDQLYLLYKIDRGIQQIQNGEGVPHEKLERQISTWFK